MGGGLFFSKAMRAPVSTANTDTIDHAQICAARAFLPIAPKLNLFSRLLVVLLKCWCLELEVNKRSGIIWKESDDSEDDSGHVQTLQW